MTTIGHRGAHITRRVLWTVESFFSAWKPFMVCRKAHIAVKFKGSISMSLDSTCTKVLLSLLGRSVTQEMKRLSKQSFPEEDAWLERNSHTPSHTQSYTCDQTGNHTITHLMNPVMVLRKLAFLDKNLGIALTCTVHSKLLWTLCCRTCLI